MALIAMPVFPWPASSQAIAVPRALSPSTSSGSTLGSMGSRYGGRNNREPVRPCWWMSWMICGCQTLYSESTVSRVSTCVNAYQSRLSSWPV